MSNGSRCSNDRSTAAMYPRLIVGLQSGLSDLIPAHNAVLGRFRNVSGCSQQANKRQA